MATILIVEDDRQFQQIVGDYLEKQGHQVMRADDAQRAYEKLTCHVIDLLISDVMLPRIDGFTLTAKVRDMHPCMPMLLITAKDDIQSKQQGFSAGIDDYMVKPIDMSEMVLRVTALLRRAHLASDHRLAIGDVVLDADSVTATIADRAVPVTLREFNILFKLLAYPNKTFSRAQLLDEFWGVDSPSSLRAVDVYITKLRDKFSGTSAFKIATVHGLGYKVVV